MRKEKQTKSGIEKGRRNMRWFAKNIPDESILDLIQKIDGTEV